MDELLEVDFAAAGKDRLYRCLDRIVAHKDALRRHLAERWKTLFDTSFDLLLYDLTSTYFEGLCQQIPKARHGYSRDGRGDCRQVVIALVVTPDGLPLAYDVLAVNTADKATLREFLARIERMYGKARRTWVMDRGIPTEATLKEMRDAGTQYLVGTPRSMLSKLDRQFVAWTPRPTPRRWTGTANPQRKAAAARGERRPARSVSAPPRGGDLRSSPRPGRLKNEGRRPRVRKSGWALS